MLHSSICQVKDFVETHLVLRAVCDTQNARIAGGLSHPEIVFRFPSPKFFNSVLFGNAICYRDTTSYPYLRSA